LISIESSSKPSPKSNNNKFNEAAPVAAAVSNSTECAPSLLESNIDELNPSVELISNSTERIVTTRIRPDSPTDDDHDSPTDDDHDSTIDEDVVSDEMVSDSGSEITDDHSNTDNPPDNASITISSVSSASSDEVYMSSPRKGLHDANLNQSFRLTQEEEFLSQSFVDPEVLLSKIHTLLKRVRKFVRMIHNSSNLNQYFRGEIKAKIASLNARTKDQNKKKYRFKELTLDMRIRWNSTYVMISRILFCSSIITSLTHDPSKKITSNARQRLKLKNLSFTSLDWSLLKALEYVLEPFQRCTKLLSTRTRPTLSITPSIVHVLTNFLKIPEDAPLTLENLLKNQLLINFNFYFEKHVTDEQSRATLVCTIILF